MKGTPCHIERNGIPICRLGIGNQAELGDPFCSYLTLASAEKELARMKRECGDAADGLVIVKGFCPASAEDAAD